MAKVLLIDDREDFCKSVERLLTAAGHQLHTAHRVEEGIRLLGRGFGDHDPYEVAVIDLVFNNYTKGPPETAGLLVLEAAVKVPFLEPIMLTVQPSVETAAEALEKGVFRYLQKKEPGIHGKLVEAVQLAAETRQVYKELDERMAGLRDLLHALRDKGADRGLINCASEYLGHAERAHWILLKARGRHPG